MTTTRKPEVTQFRFKDAVYDYVEVAAMGEIAYVENQLKKSMVDWYRTEAVMASWFISIRRAQLAAGEPLMKWPDMLAASYDDVDDIVPEATTEPEPGPDELPESEWPLDPTDAGTRTGHPAESGQMDPFAPPYSQRSGSTT